MRVVLKEERVIQQTTLDTPNWLTLTLEGRKIDAIKELRAIAGPDNEGKSLGLRQAKFIVESITDAISREYR